MDTWLRTFVLININEYLRQVALRWLLHKANIPSVTIGVKTMEQLQDNLGSLGWALTEEDMNELDKVILIGFYHLICATYI